ncbi:MAG: enoyl-CoA hydratase/isomerase family protein [Deltaproteobacteria bacterium]|nr:MAG: enoyl-CoA hydratase/isomerase family protein [Deltaproteobacteria bacterium]
MSNNDKDTGPAVLARHQRFMMSIVLNRPHVLNSLNLKMIKLIRGYLEKALSDHHCHFALIYGEGERAFCAGGDIKALTQAVIENDLQRVSRFFSEEYALDLFIHEFPKPVVVIADGITMGGGLGIAAGADIVIATERSRMAMPESRIGFFPDVGATGWMFTKCPDGYPEFLGLTGYEMTGSECVRLGFATHLTKSERLLELISILEGVTGNIHSTKQSLKQHLLDLMSDFCERDIPPKPDMDDWVSTYFSGKSSLIHMLESLSQCSTQHALCNGVFTQIKERSPTALVLTLRLLRHNEGRPLKDIFATDLKAANYITRHHDYLEGVRARVIDKDDNPRWNPAKIADVVLKGLELNNENN